MLLQKALDSLGPLNRWDFVCDIYRSDPTSHSKPPLVNPQKMSSYLVTIPLPLVLLGTKVLVCPPPPSSFGSCERPNGTE